MLLMLRYAALAGNQTFADKFSKFEPNAAYLQLPRARRANKPYVNMFRVVNKDDVVPKVLSAPATLCIHWISGTCGTRIGTW